RGAGHVAIDDRLEPRGLRGVRRQRRLQPRLVLRDVDARVLRRVRRLHVRAVGCVGTAGVVVATTSATGAAGAAGAAPTAAPPPPPPPPPPPRPPRRPSRCPSCHRCPFHRHRHPSHCYRWWRTPLGDTRRRAPS